MNSNEMPQTHLPCADPVCDGGCGDRRAPVQGEYARPDDPARPRGTVAWWEHVLAWEDYARRYGASLQSAERIAQRGGFGYRELVDHLGHEPLTWVSRNPVADRESRQR